MSKRLLVASSILRTLHLLKKGELVDAWDAAETVIQNFNDLDKLARDARPESADTSERYWVFWRESITLALEDVLHRLRDEIEISVDGKEFSKAVLAYTNQWKPEDLDGLPPKIEFTDPQRALVFQDARKSLPGFLKQFDSNLTKETLELFQTAFDRAIESSVERICSVESAYFSEMLSRSEGAAAEGVERRTQWDNHNNWIRDRFWRTPLWGQEETGISLADLYVPLRGYSHLPKQNDNNDGVQDAETKARVFDLQLELEGWLISSQPRDRMRIIGGGPGSGKSSLSKKLAMSVSEWSDWRVVFVEVQGMEETSDLHYQIGERLRRRKKTGFFENPLDWPEDRENTLIVLDGLDELSRPGPEAVELMKGFVQGVRDILFNSEGTRAVLLGRTDAARDALEASRGAVNTLINVLPLCPVNIGNCGVFRKESIKEGLEFLKVEQRELYWKNWCSAQGFQPQECRLSDPRFGELSHEPVLAYLLILSGRLDEGANLDEVAENTNVVYQDVLQNLLPRDWGTEKHPGTEGLEVDDFLFLLSCLGLAAWSGGGRVGRSEDFVRIRDHCAPNVKDFDQKIATLKNVATQFYTTSDGSYEFVHKTFGEYLAARGILRFIVDRMPELELQHKRKPDNLLYEWLELAGKTAITNEFSKSIGSFCNNLTGGILLFLRNEAALLSFEDALQAKERLTQLLNRALIVGFPAHLEPHQSWRDAERSQGFAEITLLASLNSVVRRLGKEDEDAAKLSLDADALDRLIARNISMNGIIGLTSTSCLDYIDLRKRDAYSGFISLHEASLISVNFADSDVAHINIVRSSIHKSDFIGADLAYSNLWGSLITNSNFTNASLVGTDLQCVVVEDTDFEGADFFHAKLKGTDLRGAKNLTQEQINFAHGDSQTKLPLGLHHPDLWRG